MSTNDTTLNRICLGLELWKNFTDLSQLLEEISTYMCDFATVRLEGKKKEAQTGDDRRKGKEMRQTAMEIVASQNIGCKHV